MRKVQIVDATILIILFLKLGSSCSGVPYHDLDLTYVKKIFWIYQILHYKNTFKDIGNKEYKYYMKTSFTTNSRNKRVKSRRGGKKVEEDMGIRQNSTLLLFFNMEESTA